MKNSMIVRLMIKTTKTISKTSMIAVMSTILLTSTIMAGSNLPTAAAAEGDVLQSILCAGTGVGVAFEGSTVWWVNGLFSSTLSRCDINTGLPLSDIPIVGLGGDLISTLTYDGSRNLFWATSANNGTSHNIYQIDLAGNAVLQYNVVIPGLSLVDGIAYDGETDTLWFSPDVDANIYNFDASTGTNMISFVIPKDPDNFCGNSGIAAGNGILYLGFNGCNIIQKHNKADLSLISSFVLNGADRVEDLECGVDQNGVEVIWSKDAFDVDLIAFEVPEGTCPIGGGGSEVEIDIKPGSDPSSVSCKNIEGSVPVAIFGSETFVVSTIDIETLELNRVPVTEVHNQLHIEDINNDGFDDAVLHLDKAGVCEATVENTLKESVDATLTGSTTDDPPVGFTGIGDIRRVN